MQIIPNANLQQRLDLKRSSSFNVAKHFVSNATLKLKCCPQIRLPENCKGLKCPLKARDLLDKNNKETTIIYLRAPGLVDLYRDKRVPKNRDDGWMEGLGFCL